MINRGWLKMDLTDKAPPLIYEQAWKQLRLARYRIAAAETMDMYRLLLEHFIDPFRQLWLIEALFVHCPEKLIFVLVEIFE